MGLGGLKGGHKNLSQHTLYRLAQIICIAMVGQLRRQLRRLHLGRSRPQPLQPGFA
jgi:hypothetical protein